MLSSEDIQQEGSSHVHFRSSRGVVMYISGAVEERSCTFQKQGRSGHVHFRSSRGAVMYISGAVEEWSCTFQKQ